MRTFIQIYILMKALSSNKNMPSIERKPTRKFKGLPSIHNPQNSIYHEIQQLIFKIELLPVTLQFQVNQYKKVGLDISNTSAQMKNNGDSFSVPLSTGKFKWLRLIFGQQARNVQLKCLNSENKAQKNQIYTKYQTWKCLFKEQIHSLCLQPLLLQLKNKNQKKEKLVEIQPKSSLTSFMKTRFSQRNNIKQNLLPFRAKNETISNITENQNYNTSVNELLYIEKAKQRHSINKMESQRACSTLEMQKDVKNKCFYNMKESNTSTSISIQPQVNFSKRLRRIRDIVDVKVAKSQKEVPLDGVSELFQLKRKPKFYQHVNLSQEEIEIKRKKFDSQFICKKQMLPISSNQLNALEKNESEVTEDICKIQNSKDCNQLQDTFEKGFIGNKEKGRQIEESGTLFESVYE